MLQFRKYSTYILVGIATVISFVCVMGPSLGWITSQLEKIPSPMYIVLAAFVAAMAVLLVCFVGWCVFEIYRSYFYKHVIINLRGKCRLSPKYAYLKPKIIRVLNNADLSPQSKKITPLSVERFYPKLKEHLKQVYSKESNFPKQAVNIHHLYSIGIILVFCAIAAFCYPWPPAFFRLRYALPAIFGIFFLIQK